MQRLRDSFTHTLTERTTPGRTPDSAKLNSNSEERHVEQRHRNKLVNTVRNLSEVLSAESDWARQLKHRKQKRARQV